MLCDLKYSTAGDEANAKHERNIGKKSNTSNELRAEKQEEPNGTAQDDKTQLNRPGIGFNLLSNTGLPFAPPDDLLGPVPCFASEQEGGNKIITPRIPE